MVNGDSMLTGLSVKMQTYTYSDICWFLASFLLSESPYRVIMITVVVGDVDFCVIILGAVHFPEGFVQLVNDHRTTAQTRESHDGVIA